MHFINEKLAFLARVLPQRPAFLQGEGLILKTVTKVTTAI